jgi:putative transposase
MPRPLRYDVVDVPQHVTQRGNNRQCVFFSRRDRLRYLAWLGRAARECACAIHAYVLMGNHVHLLATPREPMAIGDMLQSVGRRYVRYLNQRLGRSGTLWEGRHKASVVATGEYLMNCHRYIELNPVRAGLVARPDRYRWSSFARNALGLADPLITEHGEYTALGPDAEARRTAYRQLFEERLSPEAVTQIRRSLETCGGYGPEGFARQALGARGRF